MSIGAYSGWRWPACYLEVNRVLIADKEDDQCVTLGNPNEASTALAFPRVCYAISAPDGTAAVGTPILRLTGSSAIEYWSGTSSSSFPTCRVCLNKECQQPGS